MDVDFEFLDGSDAQAYAQFLNCLRRALAIARRVDAAPCYDGTSLRFVARVAKATALDDLGPTAREGLDRTVAEQNYPELTELWRRISCEEEAE